MPVKKRSAPKKTLQPLIVLVENIFKEAIKYNARFIYINAVGIWIQQEKDGNPKKVKLFWVQQNLIPSIQSRVKLLAGLALSEGDLFQKGDIKFEVASIKGVSFSVTTIPRGLLGGHDLDARPAMLIEVAQKA